MNARDILTERFGRKIPKRRSQKVKMKILRRGLQKKGLSLVSKDVHDCLPKKLGLYWRVFGAFPASFQTAAGRKMQVAMINELQGDPKVKAIKEYIGQKDVEVLLLYKMVKTRKIRDIDNFTKNIIDALRKGGLFQDDSQVKFYASKIEYMEVKDKRYYRAYEKVIVRVDLLNETNEPCKSFNAIFKGETKC
ncbi:RusA family crossover junction endodeoxyribonuclease [Candidatus Woesearchaeota archaeon]|nr:RusA family crossover junction endodeoxyribonuclease [Candidatus Woesearchaeota archaeon]